MHQFAQSLKIFRGNLIVVNILMCKSNCCMMPYNFKGTAIQLYAMWHGKLCHYLDNGTVHRSQLYVLRKLVNDY